MYTDATTLADMDAVATTLVLSTKTKRDLRCSHLVICPSVAKENSGKTK